MNGYQLREREIRRVVRVVFRGTSRFGKKTVSLRSSHNAYLEGAWSTNRPEVVKFYDGNEQGKQPTSNAAKRSVNQLTRRWRKLGAKVIYFRLTKVMSDSTFENLAQGKR